MVGKIQVIQCVQITVMAVKHHVCGDEHANVALDEQAVEFLFG
jgi:hypothetical protein